MADQSSKGILKTVNIVALVLVILMHMSVSGLKIGIMITDIFTSLTGIFEFIKATAVWAFYFVFRVETIYKVGMIIVLWFVGLPAMARYRFITVKPTLLLSVIITLYVFLGFRLFDVMRY